MTLGQHGFVRARRCPSVIHWWRQVLAGPGRRRRRWRGRWACRRQSWDEWGSRVHLQRAKIVCLIRSGCSQRPGVRCRARCCQGVRSWERQPFETQAVRSHRAHSGDVVRQGSYRVVGAWILGDVSSGASMVHSMDDIGQAISHTFLRRR